MELGSCLTVITPDAVYSGLVGFVNSTRLQLVNVKVVTISEMPAEVHLQEASEILFDLDDQMIIAKQNIDVTVD